ncbi:MAG: putative toxin-antitoxin system toxin component, PIN family [Bryobacteraceae bacterium]
MKVVIDTNVVVSANLKDRGPSASILDLAASEVILMCISPPIFAEYKAVLRRPRLKLDPSLIVRSLAINPQDQPYGKADSPPSRSSGRS